MSKAKKFLPEVSPAITLTTDFGTRDAYVGAMKGVIRGIAPSAIVVDITHDIAPHQIQHGAFVLKSIWPYYPEGTIHVAVVDPGVGSDRGMIVGTFANRFIVAPDNGLVTFLYRTMPVGALHAIEDRHYFLPNPSSTFHGRDIFSPVAAHLANGVPVSAFGRRLDRIELLDISYRCKRERDELMGSVLYVDRFGTCVTNIARQDLEELPSTKTGPVVMVGDREIGSVRAFFGEVPVGEMMALIGSEGLLEIAVNRGRAVDELPSLEGLRIVVRGARGRGSS